MLGERAPRSEKPVWGVRRRRERVGAAGAHGAGMHLGRSFPSAPPPRPPLWPRVLACEHRRRLPLVVNVSMALRGRRCLSEMDTGQPLAAWPQERA